jgi:hypothetical protein
VSKLRHAVCPDCGNDVTVTYWPYNVPLYTVHAATAGERDCRLSLRPVVLDQPDAEGSAPRDSAGEDRGKRR